MVSKNAMSRIVYRVSMAFCAMGTCIIPNVGCEEGVSTMLLHVAHIKYRITHMLCPTQYAAITNELNC